tara:strand:- start:355 stop:507 length:153 start_codon:yes stop_codon:yes gene_type:complete
MKKKSSIKNKIYDAICEVVPEFTATQFLQGVNFGLSLAILAWVLAVLIVG